MPLYANILACILFLSEQTEVIAAAAAGVAAEFSSPTNARAEAENAAQLSVALVENAIVILMLVEDHLRLQSKLLCAQHTVNGTVSSLSSASRSNSSTMATGEPKDLLGDRKSWSGDTGGLPLDVCACFFSFLCYFNMQLVLSKQ